MPVRKPENSRTPVLFINAAAYSGSTLLTRLLMEHPLITSVGELSGYVQKDDEPKERYCSCGEKLGACGFWKDLASRLSHAEIAFDPEAFGTKFRLFPYRYRVLNGLVTGSLGSNLLEQLRWTALGSVAAYRQSLGKIIERNEIYIETICEMTGAEVFLDGSKYASRAKFLSLSDRLDLHVVHLTRDSRGVVNSYRKNAGLNVIHGALKWSASQAKSAGLKRWFSQKYLRVRYEDLCLDPLASANRIFSFMKLPPLTGFPAGSNGPVHILGNRMRHSGELRVRQDLSWKEQLSPWQMAVITALTHFQLTRLGYLL